MKKPRKKFFVLKIHHNVELIHYLIELFHYIIEFIHKFIEFVNKFYPTISYQKICKKKFFEYNFTNS